MPKPRKYDPILNHGVSANEAAIAGALIPLDRVAVEMEAKWGVGVLPTLVSPELAGKFEAARQKLDAAIEAGDVKLVAQKAADMIKGWRALDGAAPTSRRLFNGAQFVEGDDGKLWCFVAHEAMIPAAKKRHPGHDVWSLREVARVLADNSLLARVAAKWPEAEVVSVKSSPKRERFEDDVPFDFNRDADHG